MKNPGALKSKIINPLQEGTEYDNAHICIIELFLNNYHQKGRITFGFWADKNSKKIGKAPIGTLFLIIEKTEKFDKYDKLVTLAFNDVFGKSGKEILNLLKRQNLGIDVFGKPLELENSIACDDIESETMESETILEKKEEDEEEAAEKASEEPGGEL